jgi:hypothetical protein
MITWWKRSNAVIRQDGKRNLRFQTKGEKNDARTVNRWFNDSETTQTGNGNDDITNQTIDYNMLDCIQTGDKNEAITRQNGDFVMSVLLKQIW